MTERVSPTNDVFIRRYLDGIVQQLEAVDTSSLETCLGMLLEAYRRGARVFVAGNGGSAALASHFVCDLEKTAAGTGPHAARRVRALSLSDNTSLLTAWANDVGYETVFRERLRAQADPGDLLLVISSSGNSPNIVEALKVAPELGVSTIALVGFDGGQAAKLAECAVHIPARDYGVVEAVHDALTHLITAWMGRAIQNQGQVLPGYAEPRESETLPIGRELSEAAPK